MATNRRMAVRLASGCDREEKIAANRIKRRLRRVRTNPVAVARKSECSFAWAAFIRDSNVHEAHRFLRRTTTRPRDARDSDAQCRACPPTDSIRQCKRNL